MEVLEKEHQSQALKGDVGRFVDAGPTLPDMYQPVGKLKVDYEIDELNAKLIDLKQRFKEINFDAVLLSAEELNEAGVTDTTVKSPEYGRRSRTNQLYEPLPQGHSGATHRAAAMLSMNSTLIREAPVIRSQKRVSDLVLPPMPSAPDEMLPVPSGINEWACLQDAVNHISKEKFQTHNAQLGWRKWAMMYTNANVMVDLFWWLAATFFCKDDPAAPAMREFLYHRFSRHFIKLLIDATEEGATSFQSKLRDTYQRSFIHMTAIAACNLFRAAAPRSAPLFDEQFLRAVMRQLRIWTSGLLPADAYQSSASAIQGSGAMQKKSDASQRQPVWRTLRQKHPAARHACDEAATQAARASPGSEDSDALPKLPGKAARGGFDIAKTSPFVAYFLEHHDLKPNDLHRGLLGRHVFRTHKQHQAQGEEEEEEAPCASYAEGPTAASKNAVREYEKSTRKAVRSSLSASKRLQRDLAELRFQQAAICQSDDARKMSNRLANWVDHTKEKAQQEEAERRNDLLDPHALGDMQPVEARNRRVRGRLKDGIDLQAHYHCEFSKPSARAGGYIRYTTGTASARIARQARVALGKVYSEYGATNSFGK